MSSGCDIYCGVVKGKGVGLLRRQGEFEKVPFRARYLVKLLWFKNGLDGVMTNGKR